MLVKNFQIAAFYWVALTGCGAGLVLTMPKPARADEGETIEQAAPQERPAPNTATRAKTGEDTGRPVHSLTGHKDRITSVAYSPDGRWIATAAWDGTARLWDAATGKEERRLDVPAPRDYRPGHLSRILFSPDNEFVVVAQQAAPNEAGVIVWNRRTGEKVHEFPGGYGSVAVSPDGRLIACGGWGRGVDGTSSVVRLYELATRKPVPVDFAPAITDLASSAMGPGGGRSLSSATVSVPGFHWPARPCSLARSSGFTCRSAALRTACATNWKLGWARAAPIALQK